MAFLDKPNRRDQTFPSRASDRRTDNHFRQPGNRGNNKTCQNFSIRKQVGNKVWTFGGKIRSWREDSGRRTEHSHGFLQTDRDRPGPPGKSFGGHFPDPWMPLHPIVKVGKLQKRSFRCFFNPRFKRFHRNDRPALKNDRSGGRKGKMSGSKRQNGQEKEEESHQDETSFSFPAFSGNRLLLTRRKISGRCGKSGHG